MNERRRIMLGVVAWTAAVSALHAKLNVNWSSIINEYLPPEQRKINVAYIPVT
jgi:hypothetical protein